MIRLELLTFLLIVWYSKTMKKDTKPFTHALLYTLGLILMCNLAFSKNSKSRLTLCRRGNGIVVSENYLSYVYTKPRIKCTGVNIYQHYFSYQPYIAMNNTVKNVQDISVLDYPNKR